MVKFSFPIPVRIKNSVINHLKLVGNWIKIDTIDHANALDDTMLITRVLSSNPLNFSRMNLLQNHIVKDDIAFGSADEEGTHFLPQQPGCQAFFFKIAMHIVMREVCKVIGQVGTRVVDLAGEQVLAVQFAGCVHTTR